MQNCPEASSEYRVYAEVCAAYIYIYICCFQHGCASRCALVDAPPFAQLRPAREDPELWGANSLFLIRNCKEKEAERILSSRKQFPYCFS